MATRTKQPEQPKEFTIGPGLRALRDNNGWSQGDLAKRTKKMSQQTIWSTEAGRTNPNLYSLQDLAQAFGMTVGQFVDFCQREWERIFKIAFRAGLAA